MSEEIDFQAKSDRELLIVSVMQGNEQTRHLERINGSVRQHDHRLTILETITTRPVNLSKKQAIGIGGSLFAFGTFLAGVSNSIGHLAGWW